MAWYHQYQYAEVIDPMYPLLRSKALPITRYEIRDLHILKVEVQLQPGMSKWFSVPSQVRLYKSGSDLLVIPDLKNTNSSKFQKFLKRLNLKRW